MPMDKERIISVNDQGGTVSTKGKADSQEGEKNQANVLCKGKTGSYWALYIAVSLLELDSKEK